MRLFYLILILLLTSCNQESAKKPDMTQKKAQVRQNNRDKTFEKFVKSTMKQNNFNEFVYEKIKYLEQQGKGYFIWIFYTHHGLSELDFISYSPGLNDTILNAYIRTQHYNYGTINMATSKQSPLNPYISTSGRYIINCYHNKVIDTLHKFVENYYFKRNIKLRQNMKLHEKVIAITYQDGNVKEFIIEESKNEDFISKMLKIIGLQKEWLLFDEKGNIQ
ncbi:MAG: hypothetical protein IT244_10175 [Bacteroidia bacterium]|nr:hypothetical protein [Bacteroidia bacterium]